MAHRLAEHVLVVDHKVDAMVTLEVIPVIVQQSLEKYKKPAPESDTLKSTI